MYPSARRILIVALCRQGCRTLQQPWHACIHAASNYVLCKLASASFPSILELELARYWALSVSTSASPAHSGPPIPVTLPFALAARRQRVLNANPEWLDAGRGVWCHSRLLHFEARSDNSSCTRYHVS